MQVLKNELTVYCDVDDTIACWLEPTVPGRNKIKIEFAGKTVHLTPHTYHIDLLKMYRERGYFVTVWSANGWRHAERVVKALGIEEFIDVVQTKPAKHMDDSTDAAAILGPRVFVDDLTKPRVLPVMDVAK